MLLDLVQSILPAGQRGWQKIQVRYNAWATKNGRPSRTVGSLETKFKQVSAT